MTGLLPPLDDIAASKIIPIAVSAVPRLGVVDTLSPSPELNLRAE
jgi:hypothetical protein